MEREDKINLLNIEVTDVVENLVKSMDKQAQREGTTRNELIIEVLADYLHYIAPIINSGESDKSDIYKTLQEKFRR